MAIALGTNAGFVTVAPVADPTSSNTGMDTTSRATKDTCPGGVTTVTEVGFWLDSCPTDVNFEVGLYSHDSGSDTADALLYVSRTNSSGTGAGWRTVTGLSWAVTPGTVYWIAVQLDNTTPNAPADYTSTGGRTGIRTGSSTLPNPFSSISDTNYIFAFYAKVEGGTAHEGEGSASGQSSATGAAVVNRSGAGSASAQSSATGAGVVPVWDPVVTQASWDLTAVKLGGLKVGDFQNNVAISNAGLVEFLGTAGLTIANIYNDSATIATALTLQNTWYRSYDASNAWTSGFSKNLTNGDGFIQVTDPGWYLAIWSTSIEFSAAPGASQDVEGGLMVDPDTGTYGVVASGTAHRTIANSTDTGNFGSIGILDLGANYKVGIGFNNNSSAGKTIHNEHSSLVLIQIAGT